jgi:phosphotransferase system enzyme I (PtsP)
VLRSDNVLELYATEGLKATSVHRATLTVGRGLVGLIAEEARPLNLPDAQSHPALPTCRRRRGDLPLVPRRADPARRAHARRTGGAEPLLPAPTRKRRSRRSRPPRWCSPRCSHPARWRTCRSPAPILDLNRPVHLKGRPFAEGIALGHVVLHEPRIVVTQLIAEDVDHELRRLDAAMAACASPSTTCWRAARRQGRRAPRDPGSLQDVRRGTRLGRGGCRRRSATGLPPRRRSRRYRTIPGRA